MNEENENNQGGCESKTDQVVCVDVAQLIMKQMETQTRKIENEIQEKIKKIKCFQNIFGKSTSFKFEVGSAWLKRNFNGIIRPSRSSTIFVHRCADRETFAMSVNNKNNPAFLTFLNLLDDVTVFSPDVQGAIGKIERRKADKIVDDEADIFCFVTNTKFTMRNVCSNVPVAMEILDSQGKVIGAASVSKWVDRTRYATITHLNEFVFHIADGISEPKKVMFLVAFSNWVRWAIHEYNSRNEPKWPTIICLILYITFIATVAIVKSKMLGLL